MSSTPLGRIVAGFVYDNPEDKKRNGSICKVTARAPQPIMDYPAFEIVFSDGHARYAISEQLHPWYQPIGPEMRIKLL